MAISTVSSGTTITSAWGNSVANALNDNVLTSWTSFTPTWNNITVGSGTSTGYYRYVNGDLHVRAQFTYGSGSAVTGTVTLVVPNSETSANDGCHSLGSVVAVDSGSRNYVGASDCPPNSTLIYPFLADPANSYVVNATSPVSGGWATGDELRIDIRVAL